MLALGASVAVLATVLPSAAAQDAALDGKSATSPAPGPAAGAPRVVTLITGDKVTVAPGPKGTSGSVSVERPPGATGVVRVVTEGADTYVYPEETLAYVAADRLDKRLFDVTQLIAQGYDDSRAPRLPLIVTHAKNSKHAALRSTSAELPGTQTKLALPSVDGEAITADRSTAAAFWSALTNGAGTPAAGRTAAAGAPAAPSFAAAIDKIWLDGKSEATLADSTAQIGAPQVWNTGTTGAGVRVAVLDTGVDEEHPDLAPRIVDTRSFVPDQDVTDRDGHGTHTASTVAGTGAASGGKEKGVAPDADLLIGKVLDNDGVGQESWIIAGMEWAARTAHAKVVNMSLGNRWINDQNDPMSQSLNALSAETGTLFVVAAGNSGPSPYSVSAPGTADAALTVAAGNSADQVDPRSSAGPRKGDEGLKPDLSAPGVDILAARSQYAQEGEGSYMTLSGTSMAAPHVAGAAVLLAQEHPDWTGQQLKDALMSTSRPTPGFTAYQGGSGRVDAAAAAHTEVVATGSAFAQLRWSRETPAPVERPITYTNTGDAPVTLQLAVDPRTSPAEAFVLDADEVTVPAHGSSQVNLVASRGRLAAGNYTGQVLARNASGAVVAHTTVGVSVEPERYDLTVTVKDRDGRPMGGLAEIKGALGTSTMFQEVPDSGTLTLRLAPDSYSVMMFTGVQGTHGASSRGIALLGDPEVELTQDREIALDASQAHQVRALTPKPTALVNTRLEYFRSFASTVPAPGDYRSFVSTAMVSSGYDSVWAQPTGDKVAHGSFVFTTRLRAEQTPLDVSYGGRHLDDTLAQRGSRPLPDGTSVSAAVFAGHGSAADYAGLSARGAVAVVRRNAGVSPSEQAAAARAAGAALLLVVNDGLGRVDDWYGNADGVTTGPLPAASVTHEEGEELIRQITAAPGNRPVQVRVTAHPAPAYLYDLVKYHMGAVPEDASLTADPKNLARVDVDFAQPAGKQATESRTDFPPYDWAAAPAFGYEPAAQGPRTDWVSASDDVTWQQSAYIPGWLGAQNEPTSYAPRSIHEERWFAPVVRPRMTHDAIPTRDETSLSMVLHGFSDSGAAHSGDTQYGTQMSSTVTLYQGDRQLLQTHNPYLYAYDLAPEELPYRLVDETTGDPAFSPYSARTRTEWDFTSGAQPSGTPVPLVQLDYGTDLDAAGRAARTSDLTITPSVPGAAGAGAVASVRLEVSYDDGATWQTQVLKKDLEKEGNWRASLRAPSGARFVSLRTTAKAAAGSSVTQTVVRAFGLR
ncbi:peptidase [Streptomyces brasiliensis]|uniref:Peptidase n=1 Tax=Streptomyces brasiliensis TaxID=1954 RepID=A0A917L5J5_9ACTN|nr:peptidase [Streptomyces brasiliensis]